jgi:hypothetical protein
VYERISHKAIPQKDILAMEEEYLRLFDFNLELVTPFDFHEFIFGYLNSQFICTADVKQWFPKLDELSLVLIRMSLENHFEFNRLLNLPSYMTAVAITAALILLNANGKEKLMK